MKATKPTKLNTLPKITERKKKRIGRGYGSGKGGHTVGRGTKGQRARESIKTWFEGGQLALVRRLPKIRGKARFKSLKHSRLIVNLKSLNNFPKDSLITVDTLVKAGIVREDEAKTFGVKILGEGEVKVPLTVKLPISKQAKAKIIKGGGKVE